MSAASRVRRVLVVVDFGERHRHTDKRAALHRSRPSADQSGKRVARWTGKSPDMPDLLCGHSREDVRNKSGVSGDFPVHLATRLPDWSADGLLRCSAARLSVCQCRSPKSTSTTRTTCCGHPRKDVTSMLRGCYEENCFCGI